MWASTQIFSPLPAACVASELLLSDGSDHELKRLDPTRPVQYERGSQHAEYGRFDPWYWAYLDEITEIVAPMYPYPSELEAYAQLNASKPVVMCEVCGMVLDMMGGNALTCMGEARHRVRDVVSSVTRGHGLLVVLVQSQLVILAAITVRSRNGQLPRQLCRLCECPPDFSSLTSCAHTC